MGLKFRFPYQTTSGYAFNKKNDFLGLESTIPKRTYNLIEQFPAVRLRVNDPYSANFPDIAAEHLFQNIVCFVVISRSPTN